MRSLLQLGSLVVVALAASACSWSRFDDVTDDAPIVLFEKPGALKSGFGVSLSTATLGSQTSVLIGGAVGISGAALYDIGEATSPGTTAVDSGYCTGGAEDCFLSSTTAGFANARGPDATRPLCFAVGTGQVENDTGLVFRCQDASEYTLDMPTAAQKDLAFTLGKNQPNDYPLAADRTDDPVLLVTFPAQRLAWFYPSKSIKFSELAPAPDELIDDDTFGSKTTVLTVGDVRVFAIAVPKKSEVLLWKTDGGNGSVYLGCLGGISGMGRALASGPVNDDSDDDLVLSDDSNVHVIDGRALAELPETDSTECSFSSLPAGALLGSFGCGSNGSLSGCATSEFGAALAVGDLDGDEDGEVIVGAPNMTVRGESGAGALLVYDVEGNSEFVDAKFLSSAEGSDGLGASIVTPHIQGRDIIVAGAPGNGKAALFYCSSLLEKGAAGSRCP